MAASDHLGKQFELYHGTTHPFNEGDIVAPRSQDSENVSSGTKYAYATPNRDVALSRAHDAVNYSWNDASKAGVEYSDWKSSEAASPKVFRVEPIGETKTDKHGSVMSPKGFRVLGKAE